MLSVQNNTEGRAERSILIFVREKKNQKQKQLFQIMMDYAETPWV